MDTSIDTSELNYGILFDDNNEIVPEEEQEILAPSLMPDHITDLLKKEMSGDDDDEDDDDDDGDFDLLIPPDAAAPVEISFPPKNDSPDSNELASDNEINLPFKINLICDEIISLTPKDLSYHIPLPPELEGDRNSNQSSENDDLTLLEDLKEDPPFVLTELEEEGYEGAIYRQETSHEFQDEAGLQYGENAQGKVWSDDEGFDPLENQ
ncbi:hypothetical protein G9A89_020334 [Geosiphon pyriformis]|nr:hypothetical protein G9A89_020334 [Geosiphon pyriformis]